MATSAGSILDNGTKASPGVLYYGGAGGGSTFASASISSLTVSSINGAAPGGASGPAVATSSLTVSSIVGAGGGPVEMNTLVQISSIGGALGPGGLTAVQNGLEFQPGAGAVFSALGEIIFSDSLGVMTGVSSINGSAYPPAVPANANMTSFNFQSGGNFYVPAGGATVPLASFSTTASHLYQLEMPIIRVQNEPAGVPQAGAWADMSIDTAGSVTYLDTFDMVSVSTIQNDLQKSGVYSFIASGANHTLSANGNLANTLSTAITVIGKGYLKDLGDSTSYPSAN